MSVMGYWNIQLPIVISWNIWTIGVGWYIRDIRYVISAFLHQTVVIYSNCIWGATLFFLLHLYMCCLLNYGGLKQVMLYCVRITTSAITTLISNSPNLILLHIILYNDYSLNLEDYKKTVSKKFSKHKLFTVGDFFIEYRYRYCYTGYHDFTYFKSLWYNIRGCFTCCKLYTF